MTLYKALPLLYIVVFNGPNVFVVPPLHLQPHQKTMHMPAKYPRHLHYVSGAHDPVQ